MSGRPLVTRLGKDSPPAPHQPKSPPAKNGELGNGEKTMRVVGC